MPKLWTGTIEAHRRAVVDATLDTAAALVAEHGLRGVTMSQIAERTGIGRATLYKYFPDVEAILLAWHDRHAGAHLEQLARIRDRTEDPGRRLAAVLEAFAAGTQERARHQEHQTAELVAFLHRDEHLEPVGQRLRTLVRDLLADAAAAGHVRTDIGADELAGYCLHALGAAATLPSKAAVRRLVTLTLAGLRPS
ncbi:MAG TPA: TetR/AcrR family transcriptional regulator [Actinophytocola sp.]|uniref:TetR/AcrR family transcriptional regulator n=1 Tax=Actinophytocola sp. TaxID=1872138 RepID=UPI002DBD4BFB|nr:TetR/AcrR family transcriptional regulator [Actinophytocola sp.]HEU5470670.1 TetR/AcrR family transcriptional regulator [Actinophytocola sp.]